MNIQDIAHSREKKVIFDIVLEEACRQWCSFVDEAPERKNGEGFADFFYELFEEKEKEYVQEVRKLNGGKLPYLPSAKKDKER